MAGYIAFLTVQQTNLRSRPLRELILSVTLWCVLQKCAPAPCLSSYYWICCGVCSKSAFMPLAGAHIIGYVVVCAPKVRSRPLHDHRFSVTMCWFLVWRNRKSVLASLARAHF